MANGLFAALSPNEEATLRLIARDTVHLRSLRERDVIRLLRLDLIEQSRTGISLSALGQQRVGAAPLGLDSEDRSATR